MCVKILFFSTVGSGVEEGRRLGGQFQNLWEWAGHCHQRGGKKNRNRAAVETHHLGTVATFLFIVSKLPVSL